MTNNDEGRMWPDPIALLQTLIANSPEMNVKVALINLIEFLADWSAGNGGNGVASADDLMEVVSQSLAYLHHHVGEDIEDHEFHDDDHDVRSGIPDGQPAPSADELLQMFRDQLGSTEEEGK